MRLAVLALAWWLIWNPHTMQDFGGVAGPFATSDACERVKREYLSLFAWGGPSKIKCVSDEVAK